METARCSFVVICSDLGYEVVKAAREEPDQLAALFETLETHPESGAAKAPASEVSRKLYLPRLKEAPTVTLSVIVSVSRGLDHAALQAATSNTSHYPHSSRVLIPPAKLLEWLDQKRAPSLKSGHDAPRSGLTLAA